MSKLVAKNAFILTFVEILSKVIELLSFVFLARILGVEKYGLLNFVYAVGTIFILLPHFGFDQLVARDIARQKEKTGEYLVGVSLAKIFLFAVTLIFLAIWLEYFSHFESSKKALVYVGTGGIFFLSNILFSSAFFRAYQRAVIEASIRVSMAIVMTLISVIAILISPSLLNLLIVRLVVSAMVFIVSICMIVKMLNPDFSGVWKNMDINFYIKKGWPFAVFIFFIAIYVSVDVVMLSLIVGDKATGFYSVATKIIVFFILVPTGISNAVLPAMSEKVKSDFDGFLKLANSVARFLLILAIMGMMFNIFLGPAIIVILFGKEYLPSGSVLMILSCSLIPSYLNHLWNSMLLSFNKEKVIIIFAVTGAVFNILLNLILIPKYSYYGAAVATILTEAGVVLFQYVYIKRNVLPQISMLVDNRMVFLIGIFMILFMAWIFPKWLFAGFIPALLGYILVLFKFKYLDKEDFFSFSRYLLKKS